MIVKFQKMSRIASWKVQLVKDYFEVKDDCHPKQMAQEKVENEGKISQASSKRCSMCDSCMSGDCGVCNHCKFGGSGMSKQACKEMKCNNMAVKETSSGSSSSKPKKDKNQPSIMSMFKKAARKKEEKKYDNEKNCKSSCPENNVEKKLKSEGTTAGIAGSEVTVAGEKVGTCRQLVDSPDTIWYESHPQGAVEEFIGMSDPKLSGDFQEESKPRYKLTGFTVYDKAGHVVPFDSGLIDMNKEIFFSGYLKHLTCEDPGLEDSVPVFDCGPINSWWNAGFDEGEKALTGFSTGYAEYYLMECSETYTPFMKVVDEKAFTTKHVIEYLEKAIDPNNHIDAEYEDLLNHLGLIVPPEGMNPVSDETLLRHADFVVHQVGLHNRRFNWFKTCDF